ncbi:carbohydrate binding [Desmophyllum pertusum]|uniref:Carbohydrate binding n=1 Tax=Desmophyllum pertusum TaxID=174260 RepID=A0A9W9YEP8_9CNID|nr:carbohydrate binding [Desmophyllum pertusum]
MTLVLTALATILLVAFAECKLSDVPDNVQLQKNSDINLMEVLESLAPVTSEEVVAIRPTGEGEWDSGHAASSKTKKSVITGEDASGSGEGSGVVEQEEVKPVEQDKPVVIRPTNSVEASTSDSEDEGSSVAPSPVTDAVSEDFASVPQPPPVAISHNTENKPPSAGAVSFNAAEPEESYSAQQVSLANKTALNPVPTEEGQQKASNNEDAPESSGLGEGAHPVPSADTNQEHAASGSGRTSGSGLNADELAFIAGLQNAKQQQSTAPQTPKRTKLPGSVGNDDDDSDDDNDGGESGDVSGEQSDSSASGSQEDETTDESQDVEAHQRSETSQTPEKVASEEDEEEDDTSASDEDYDDDDEDDSGESSADETQRKDTIVDVASGSGVSFLSGVGQSESDDGSSESSGEDDDPGDDLPGSIGEVNDIEKLEQKPAQPEAAPGSGEEELPGSVGGIADIRQLESEARTDADTDASGSGESIPSSVHSASQFSPEESLLEQVLPSVSSGSGEPDKQEESLPGSVGGQISIDESQDSSNLGSGEEAVKIVSPASGMGSGESPTTRSDVAVASVAQDSDSSGSGSDEQLSGSGIADDLQSLASSSEDDDETLPGSIGAVGPNLMTMASPENKPAGSGMADQSGDGSGVGSGLEEQANLMKTFQFSDSSGSVGQFDNLAQTKPTSEKEEEGSGEFDLLKSLQPPQGSGVADEPLPGGFGNGDSADIQSLAGSGGEDASGFAYQSGSGFGSFMDEGLSASGSAEADVIADLSGASSSGSGKFYSDSNEYQSLSKKDYAPTASASASASAEQDSGSSSGSASQPLPVAKHTYLPTPKRVGTGISSTTLAAPASGSSSSGQSDSGASALPGSVGIEESFSSSGSAIFDTSGSGMIPNIADFPQEDLLSTEDVETSASGAEDVNVVESGAGEGSGAQPSGDEGIEETILRSHTGKLKPISFNLDSTLQADLGKIPINLGVGSGSTYGLGSGAGIEYGSASDFLSGSAGSGTLELTPATNPSDAIVNLFGSTFIPAEKESDSESSSTVAQSGEGSTIKHKLGKNRHEIPISGDDEIAAIKPYDDEIEYDLPKAGDTVDQQLLDRFMISQILEQNLTLFYGGLAGRPGKQGSSWSSGSPGMQGMSGSMGPPGAMGEVGAPGADGEGGIFGPPGLSGYPGFLGEQGHRVSLD